MERLPTFLIIGAGKSGTSSLHAYLRQHPGVFLSRFKEPNFFALAGKSLPHPGPAPPNVLSDLIYRHCVTDYDEYAALFRGANGYKAIGEASVRYLYYPEAGVRIKQTIPDVRLVAILREPVSRLYSHYCMNVQYQLEPLPLRDALRAEDARRNADWGWDWHYVNVSRYADQVERYVRLFDGGQLKVFLYDDFVARPLDVFQEVCRHIGVDDQFVPDMSRREKVAYRPKYLKLDRWLHWPNPVRTRLQRIAPRKVSSALIAHVERWNSAPVPRLEPEMRRELAGLFRRDVRQLESLLGRRVPWTA